jgi:hypothetical protein
MRSAEETEAIERLRLAVAATDAAYLRMRRDPKQDWIRARDGAKRSTTHGAYITARIEEQIAGRALLALLLGELVRVPDVPHVPA